MPIDLHAQRLLTMLAARRHPDPGSLTTEERRNGFAALMRLAGVPPPVAAVIEAEVEGADGLLPARIYVPADEPAGLHPALVYFHGGGFVAGGLDTHDALCRALAAGSGCRVIAVAYRLAPEHPFPAAVEDAEAAVSDSLDRATSLGLDSARIAVGGDSAGATLATLAAHALKYRAGPRPALQMLLCPVLDVDPGTRSRATFGDGYLLDAALMARDLADYAPDGWNFADPRLSPLRALDLAGMPDTQIHTAEYDPLRDEGALYAERLGAAGVAVTHRCHSGMVHHFYGLTGFIPAAKTALAEIALALGQALACVMLFLIHTSFNL